MWTRAAVTECCDGAVCGVWSLIGLGFWSWLESSISEWPMTRLSPTLIEERDVITDITPHPALTTYSYTPILL